MNPDEGPVSGPAQSGMKEPLGDSAAFLLFPQPELAPPDEVTDGPLHHPPPRV